MKILIIGGKGYVGSYLKEELWNSGIYVESYGNRSKDYNDIDIKYLQQFSHIILLAGHSSVQMCNGPLRSAWLNNVRNFINLVEKTSTETKIIYASSASVYGDTNEKMYTEADMSLDFVNNYDLTKVTLDLVAQKYIAQHRYIMGLRFGTVNGGSPVIRRDLMINSMVYTALNEGKIVITNKHINRPILALKDLALAIKEVLLNKVFRSGHYNLASFNSTVEEISKEVQLKTGVEIIDKGDTPGVYNFEIDNYKFTNYYRFNFKETISSTVDDVINCYTKTNPNVVIRNEYFQYD